MRVNFTAENKKLVIKYKKTVQSWFTIELDTLSAHAESVKFSIHCRPLQLSREYAPLPAWGNKASVSGLYVQSLNLRVMIFRSSIIGEVHIGARAQLDI